MAWYYQVREKASKKILIETYRWQRAIDKWSRSETHGIPASIIGTNDDYVGHWDTTRLIQAHSEQLREE